MSTPATPADATPNPVALAGDPPPRRRLSVLLVEDDDSDAFLVTELLAEVGAAIDVSVASTLAQARARVNLVDCILLDLGLPDANGLDGLRAVLRIAKRPAVCVLTGLHDEHLGVAAVAEGAQDYLVKGQVDGVLLSRALRYAVERKRADDNARRLREADLRQAESARLERGLLPQPLMRTDLVTVNSFYRAGRQRGLIGGDFYDVVQLERDRIHFMVGDVCGHSVEGAALGVELRVAWRALVLGRVAEDAVLPSLEQVLMSERATPEVFATVAMVSMELSSGRATVRLAGHPPPLLLGDGACAPLAAPPGRLLGVVPRPPVAFQLDLPPGGYLLMYTDGLIEGRAGDDRLDIEGLCAIGERALAGGVKPAALPAWLVGQAERANGGPLADDVAILLVGREAA